MPEGFHQTPGMSLSISIGLAIGTVFVSALVHHIDYQSRPVEHRPKVRAYRAKTFSKSSFTCAVAGFLLFTPSTIPVNEFMAIWILNTTSLMAAYSAYRVLAASDAEIDATEQ